MLRQKLNNQQIQEMAQFFKFQIVPLTPLPPSPYINLESEQVLGSKTTITTINNYKRHVLKEVLKNRIVSIFRGNLNLHVKIFKSVMSSSGKTPFLDF